MLYVISSKSRSNMIETSNTHEILNFVRMNPGNDNKQIAEALDINLMTVYKQLHYLLKNNQVVKYKSKEGKRQTRYVYAIQKGKAPVCNNKMLIMFH